MADKKRDYKQEAKYHATPEQKKRRAIRNAARRKMEEKGLVKKGDGKDVDHVRGISGNKKKDNADNNLKAKPKSDNRSFPRKADGSKKNKTD